MPILSSALDLCSASFRANAARMSERLAEVRALEQKVRDESASKRDNFEKRGQILPRERVALLLDRDSDFIELSSLAGLGMHDDDGVKSVLGGGSIVGIGMVTGKRCVILASDSAIKGGTVPPMGIKKHLRAQEIARDNRLPMISLIECGGANLIHQSEVFIDAGRIFANQARLSAAGIPQIAVVHGSSTGGGAYLPGLSDYVILVKGRAHIYLASPPLVKAAIGEDCGDETLGGAKMHATVTGLGEYLCENDPDAIAVAREVMDKLKWAAVPSAPTVADPRYDAEELLGVVPADERKPYDVREVIMRVVDASDFLEFKALYGVGTVCGHARIGNHLVGIVGNNGPIQPEGSSKVAHFVQLCDQGGTPLIFLQNTTGYMVGTVAERAGAVKHAAQMAQAVANARVPKLTIVLGGSYGAGSYCMCGRGFDPRFIFSWPSARAAVMGSVQAANVMKVVRSRSIGQRGGQETQRAEDENLRLRLEREATALFGTARLWDDGIIDPRDTRRVIMFCLDICDEDAARALRPNTFGVSRF